MTSASETSSSGMLIEPSTRPVLRSSTDGIPKPSAANGGPRAVRPPRAIPSRSSSCEPVGVGTSHRSSIVPSRSSRAARIFVPPRSTPMTRWELTGRGYHTRPDGGRREALPGLQGRPGQRKGSAHAPSGEGAGGNARAADGAPAGRRWGRRIGIALALLFLLLVVWTASQLPLVPGRRRGRERKRCPGRSRANLAKQDGAVISKPSLILLLGTDGDRTAAREDARRSDSILLVRTDPKPPPALVPLDPARPARRHPRPRPEQDQRRLPARRARAGDEDGQRAHRACSANHVVLVDFEDFRDVIDALGGDRGRRAEADPLEPLRLPVRDRRALPGVAGLALREGEAEDGRPARADLLAHPREPARPGRERPHARRAASRRWSRR